MRAKTLAYRDGYANLAAAIIEDGMKHNDEVFLKSDWCDMLRGLCQYDDEMHNSVYSTVSVRIKRTAQFSMYD